MKRIVVAFDFSEIAMNALEYAAGLARDHSYELVLFTLQNPSVHAVNARLSAESIDKSLERKSQELQDQAKSTQDRFGVHVSTYFSSGEFHDQVCRCIEKYGATLLVMGMAAKSVEQDMMGNTTTSVLRRLQTPILSVPLGAEYKGIKHILFACDIVRGVHKTVLDRISEFSANFGAVVEVFNVSEKIQEISQSPTDIQQGLSEIEYYYKNVSSGSIVDAIRDEIKSSNTDLLVMVPYKYGFWSALVHRSKTRMMASGNSVPLLTITLPMSAKE